jgi:hypothetical protein
MKTYKFQAKFIEIDEIATITNSFIVPMAIPEKDYELAVVRALYNAQETLRTLDGHYFFRLEVTSK